MPTGGNGEFSSRVRPMPRQPGDVRAQTIMIPVGSPATVSARAGRSRYASPQAIEESGRSRDAEIRKLQALLNAESSGQGGGGGDGAADELVGSLTQQLAESAQRGNLLVLQNFLGAVLDNDSLAKALAELEGASRFGSLIELARRRKGAKALHAVVNDLSSTALELRAAVGKEPWVFGGRYMPPVSLRGIDILHDVDLVLMRSDGAIHLVTIGPANVPDVIERQDDGLRVGPLVIDLVQRTMNFLHTVEAQEELIREKLGVESKRALATVLVGHPGLATEKAKNGVRDTLRTYSSRLVGLEIMTYQELMAGVDQTLELYERGELDPRAD